jgi:hypothetical protein
MAPFVDVVARFGDLGAENQATSRTAVLLPDDVVAAIDELVGHRGRTTFVTEAAREAIARRQTRPDVSPMQEHVELEDIADAFVPAHRDDPADARGYR